MRSKNETTTVKALFSPSLLSPPLYLAPPPLKLKFLNKLLSLLSPPETIFKQVEVVNKTRNLNFEVVQGMRFEWQS